MSSSKRKFPTKLSALLIFLLLAACGDKPDALLLSAKEYLAKNDNKAAVIQIKNVLQSNPDLPEARYLLGKALLDGGDPVGAETEFRKALDLKYTQDAVLPSLAHAILEQGNAKKLSDEFASIELQQPQAKASLLMSISAAYAMQGKTALSQSALAAALQAGTIAGAGLDVYEVEPLPADHPIRTAPRALLTTHVAWYSESSIPRLQQLAAEEVVRCWRGEFLKNCVN